MNSSSASPVQQMLIVECPLCGSAAPFDAVAGELTCDDCGVALDVAPDPRALLAAAA